MLYAAGGEGRVDVGQLERREPDRAERDRAGLPEVRPADLLRDPEVARHVLHVPHTDPRDELGEDRVHGLRRRGEEVHRARRLVGGVVDVPVPVALPALRRDDVQLRRPVEGRVDRVARAQGGRERNRLEGAARRPLGLRGKVELHPSPARKVVDHGLHGAGLRIDRHERRSGIGRGVQDRADRVDPESLQAHVERRLDLESAELHLPLAVLAQLLGELLRRPAEEARLVLLRVEVARPELELLPRRAS